jgi:murein DD-endopeptidase MepM/ murein hydrolase activator NlpD
MDATAALAAYIKTHRPEIGKVVDYNPANDRFYPLDLTAANTELTRRPGCRYSSFQQLDYQKLADNQCRYGIGGYMEHRTIYTRSTLFDTEDEPRRLHLGVDIWGDAGIPIYAFLAGKVHSFADNNNHGDYGPTIILQHNLDGLTLFSLYGHLSRTSLVGLEVGQP